MVHPLLIGLFSLPRRVITLLLASVLGVLGLWGAALPASATPVLTVTSTTTTSALSGSTTTLEGLSLTPDDPDDTYQVTVSTDVGTLTFPETSDLDLGYGNDWSGTGSVTFTGSPTAANSALAAVELVTGSDGGKTAKVSVTALKGAPGYVYASNGHFYQYVADSAITWTDARAAAKTMTFLGQDGYLATITSAEINDLISSRIEGANNVWFGGHSIDTLIILPIQALGQPVQRTWEWADGPLAGNAFTYCSTIAPCDFVNDDGLYHSWASGEPNSASEPYAVTNWRGGKGNWNDLPDSVGSISGYVVEYGDQAQGASSFPGVASATAEVAVVSTPDAPEQVTATQGNGTATITFTAPAANESPITGYTITTSPGGATTECDASPCTVTGLDNGTAYTFTVTATNANGAGPPSTPSSAVVPATVPDAPTAVSASGGDDSATVEFTAPADNGGAAITSYTVTASPGGQTATCPGSPCMITGLTNGETYTFTVTANNPAGISDPSEASSSVIVQTVPSAPTGVSATASDGAAAVAFDESTDDGGAEITGYLVTSSPGGKTASCTASPCVVTGLTNGTGYTFTVQATNAAGVSDSSTPSEEVTPVTVPTSPLDLTVSRADNSADLTFLAPEDDGGATITGYQVSSDGGDHWKDLDTTGTAPISATVTGLSNGTEYTIAVRAVNKAGHGPATELSNVTPAAEPGKPTNVNAGRGDQEATITFTAPSDNGSKISGYTVVVAPGDREVSCDGSPCVVTGLDNGTAYTFKVYATNDVGDSELSEETDPVTPATVPDAPRLRTMLSVDQGLVLYVGPPRSDGGEPVLGYEVSLDGGDTWDSIALTGNPNDTILIGTVTGLDNGTTYDAIVRAVNAVGASRASSKFSGTPATTPSPPRSVAVTVAGGAATVTWRAPERDGGSPVERYTVTAQPGGQTCRSRTLSCTFADLTPGVTYTFSVVASNYTDGRNGTGLSEASVSDEVFITGPPDAPEGLSVTPGDRTLSLTFDQPYNDGGREITAYQVSLDGGDSWQALATTLNTDDLRNGIVSACRVGGGQGLHASGCGLSFNAEVVAVLNGTNYSVAVRAVNGNGTGSSTAAVEVTPVMWFSDQVSNTDRAAEIAVPKSPTKYKGPMQHTKAYYRSHSGSVAYPAPLLEGRQLQQPQAVLVKGSYFPAKKTTLTSAGKAEIKAMAESFTYVKEVTCEGYAGYGGDRSHAAKFSKARAATVCAAVKKYAKSVTSSKTVGYGGDYPMIVGGKSADRELNRRVIVQVRTSTPIRG